MSNCNVCIGGDYDYDGYPEFYFSSTPKARKDHQCCECRQVIRKGQQYEAFASKYDGRVSTVKTCFACADIRTVYSCDENPPPFGEMWNMFHETGSFDDLRMAGECWDSLSAPAKAKLLEEWRKWKGL